MSQPGSPQPNLTAVRAQLLRSGRTEKPSSKTVQRTLVAVGIGAASGLGAPQIAAATGTVVWKWLGLGVLVGALSIGVYKLAAPQKTPSVVLPLPASASSEPVRNTQSGPLASSEAPASLVTAPAQSATSSERTAHSPSTAVAIAPASQAQDDKPSAPASAIVAPKSPDLAGEIAALDEARRAVNSGDSEAALRALNDHKKNFPGSQLDHEATVLRVEALLGRGQCDAARAQATAFLNANPRSSVAQRLRSLLDRPCPPPTTAAPAATIK